MSPVGFCDILGKKKFKSGFMSVMDEDREERPPFVVAEDNNVTIVKTLVRQDRRITVNQLSSETGLRIGSKELILIDHLNIKKGFFVW